MAPRNAPRGPAVFLIQQGVLYSHQNVIRLELIVIEGDDTSSHNHTVAYPKNRKRHLLNEHSNFAVNVFQLEVTESSEQDVCFPHKMLF